MTLYEVLFFFHILAVAIWVGGNAMSAFLNARAERSEATYRARFIRDAGVYGVVIGVSAVVVLGTGLGMVLDSELITLSQTWVWLGLALFAVSVIIAASYIGPASSKIVAALEAGQMEEADRRVKQFDTVVRLDLLLVIVILAVMVFKPGA
jgi:uncharacterized membrane protein